MTSEANSKRVLITGGSGFVGGALARHLAGRGHEVIATCTGNPANAGGEGGVAWVNWNALDTPLPEVDWGSLDAVYHIAVPRSLFEFPADAPAIFTLCLDATFRILARATEAGVGRMVLASTGDVLGASPQGAHEDDSCFDPGSFYGAAKAGAELITRAFEGSVSTAVARIFHPYGPGGDNFLINQLVRKVAAGDTIAIEGDDGIRLNPVWIDDLAEGLGLLLDTSETATFHFAGDEILSLRELLVLIGEITGKAPRITNSEAECIERHCGDFTRARTVLDYAPQVTLKDGLARLAF
jgi:nucleoside-diphosphate-sugar epimerase